MNRILIILIAMLIVGFALTHARAQEPSTAAQKRALIKELLAVTGNKEDMDNASNMMLAFQQEQTQKIVEAMIEDDKVMTAEQKTELKKTIAMTSNRVAKRLEEFFAKELRLDQMVDEVAFRIYEKNFTVSELRELVAFHKTPAGQKSVKVAPEMMMGTLKVFSEQVTPKLTQH
jgi:uncharacterized protein